MARTLNTLLLLTVLGYCGSAHAERGLLFSLSGGKGLTAETSAGPAAPLFAAGAGTIPDGATGPGLGLSDSLTLAWQAKGNIHAQRGTLAFMFRPREPLGLEPFPVFRVGASEGTSWDMTWLRIDWNGHGFDAFVTDTNLSRTRVSFRMDRVPDKTEWIHVAFAWDEASGVKLWINGKPAARKDQAAVYDTGLFGFGPFQRIVSPYQVHSMYNFRRSGDMDEVRIYDRMLDDTGVATLARNEVPSLPAAPADLTAQWRKRYGFDGVAPAYLAAPVTRIRKVEFIATRDMKAKMFRGADGIRETTWPGVYNRSRLPGRHDYFELPDWNVYSEGGKAYDLSLPDEPWNRIELTGAAYGQLRADDAVLFTRPKGAERTSTEIGERRGGHLRFENTVQETPIQEIAAYYVTPGEVPLGSPTLSYTVDASADPALYPALDALRGFIDGRMVEGERQIAVALPRGAARKTAKPSSGQPVVHILIPGDFRDTRQGEAPTRFSYGWQNMDAGLDGIAIDLPAMKVAATHGELLPLNIRVRDPSWPERDLLDVNVSVKPGEARTLWLDTRDRILPDTDSLMISIAATDGGFDSQSLNGAQVRLVFKAATEAKAEHVADRLEQARDNLAFFVEEQPNIRVYPLWTRFERDISDVLRVDPGNETARAYWVEKNPEQPYGAFVQPEPPAGTPLWAFRQVEDLKLYKRFIDWWIDERQAEDGEFGGGLSDDTDLTNAWVGLAVMGVDPERYVASQRKLLDATYANQMWSGGLSRITTDELHSYEEGINAVAQSLQMDWGNPTAIERAMATAREYPRLFETNPAGHRHMVSAWFSGTHIAREGHLGWQRPFGLLLTHPGLLLVDYNGAPETKKLLLDVADGWLAHGKQDDKGGWSFPSDIEWSSDQANGNGVQSGAHLFWAAYSWTGDPKYLRPFDNEFRRGNLGNLSQINADLLGRTPAGAELTARVIKGEVGGRGAAVDRNLGGIGDAEFAAFVRWQKTGDKAVLETLYGREIETTTRRMPVLTEAHLWSDRVSVPTELLQRTRLGGVAHRRNAYYPGHLASWRFRTGKAEDVAILMPDGNPESFRVIAYNLSDADIAADLIGAQMAPGTWRISGGIDANGDDVPDTTSERSLTLERGKAVDLTFPSHQTLVYRFERTTPGDDPATRPDVGLSRDDIKHKGRKLSVRVHSLGAKPTPAGTVIVEDASGREVIRKRFAALAAPLDLTPKTLDISVSLTSDVKKGWIKLELDGAVSEVTELNNVARWGSH